MLMHLSARDDTLQVLASSSLSHISHICCCKKLMTSWPIWAAGIAPVSARAPPPKGHQEGNTQAVMRGETPRGRCWTLRAVQQ